MSRIGPVGRDESTLRAAVLRREPLEQLVRRLREANLERADRSVLADAVEDDDAARAAQRDEAGEPVDELLAARRTPPAWSRL